jgi:esterase/lipase superfamily enzyme
MFEYVIAAVLGGVIASIAIMLAIVLYLQVRRYNDEQSASKRHAEIDRQIAGIAGSIAGIAGSIAGLRHDIEALSRSRGTGDDARLNQMLENLKQLTARQSADDARNSALKEKLEELIKKLTAVDDISLWSSGTKHKPLVGGWKNFPRYTFDDDIFGTPSRQYTGGVSTSKNIFGTTDDGRIAVVPLPETIAVPGVSRDFSKPFTPYKLDKNVLGGITAGNYSFESVLGSGPPAGSAIPAATPAPPPSLPPHKDLRVVDLLFATTRKYDDAVERFTGERNNQITFGHAHVRVPELHDPGQVERPYKFTLFSLTLYEADEDQTKHFVIKDIQLLPKDEWNALVGQWPADEALVFVHGFNNSFEDALYRNAQIISDLSYKGVPVLFSWPSRGRVLDYLYDRDSALGARRAFISVLETLQQQPNIKKVHILAHSMGNLVVLDALASHPNDVRPLKLGELMMAAPDVDRDQYKGIAGDVRKIVGGMTLYASSADLALAASKKVAGNIARAGDVPDKDGPIVLPDIDSIDVTKLGEEIFGLNHGTYAQSRSVLNDVGLLLEGKRPPDQRLKAEIKGVPFGVVPPRYWQYI